MVVMMMNNNSKEMEQQHLGGGGGGSASSTTSEGNSASSTSPDSPPNTLKFGQKIYFQHVGPGAQPKSPSGSSSSSPPVAGAPAPAKKGRGGRIPRCQVEGCEADLSDVKAYYGRHKVCATHSKSPTVVVAGLEQRFCQQCSRFHRLSEFDQGKRSCRRRLAGHNERRRKPPPGSLLSTRYGSLSSSLFENNSRSGSFLVDFSSYPNLTERSWPNTRASERGWDNHSTGSGKFPQSPWPSGSGNSTPELVLQDSAARATSYAGPGIPSGNCFTGVSNSSGALSLLSNESWGSRNQPSSLGINSLVNTDGGHTFQPSGSHVAPINHFSGPQWGFKGNEGSSSSHNMPPDLGLGQIPRHSVNQYSELGMAPQSGRHYMELEHSKGYDSSVQNVHWTL